MNLISIYNILNILLFPCYILVLLVRLIKGKENIASIRSRMGIYSYRHGEERLRDEAIPGRLTRLPRHRRWLSMTPSVSNNVKLIWIHAASVGESMIAITLIKELKKRHPSLEFLITTGTLSSASIINKWLPEGVYHEFTPLDNWLIVKRFHQYWQPTLGIFLESELWPTLLQCSSEHCKLLLLNARLSDKSFHRWQRYSKIFSMLTNFFSLIAVQSDDDFKKYQSLGCKNLENLGNLKFAHQKLQFDTKELDELKKIFKNKKIFVASSTHFEDEEVVLNVVAKMKQQKTNIYPIIILRHPERAEEITAHCQKLGLKYSLKSRQKLQNLNDDLYIVDSFGELGLFYSLSDIVFIGGSFKRGGHNMLEPAYFDNVILLGPDMSNWKNIADEMIKNKAAIQIKDTNELQEKIKFFLEKKNDKIAKEYSANAKEYVGNKEAVLAKYLEMVEKFLL